jgi:hypothetical protein
MVSFALWPFNLRGRISYPFDLRLGEHQSRPGRGSVAKICCPRRETSPCYMRSSRLLLSHCTGGAPRQSVNGLRKQLSRNFPCHVGRSYEWCITAQYTCALPADKVRISRACLTYRRQYAYVWEYNDSCDNAVHADNMRTLNVKRLQFMLTTCVRQMFACVLPELLNIILIVK